MRIFKILNELVVFTISLLLIIILNIYSNEPGIIIGRISKNDIWYSTELQSSGGDEFYVFLVNIYLNIISLAISGVNIIVNILVKKTLHFSYYCYMVLFVLQCFVVWLVDSDISIFGAMLLGDKFMILWGIVFFIGFLAIIISKRIVKYKNSKYVA